MLGPLYGRENLAAFFAAQVRARATGEPVVIHIVGDSKVHGDGTTDGYRLDQLLLSAANGYPVQITYEGFGGQNSYLWANTEAADFVAEHANADLLIVDFGTNERRKFSPTGGDQTIQQTEANHRYAINLIRASRSASSLSILLLGQLPCNNYDPDYNQTTAIMVEVNAVLKTVADSTNNAFFDPLELFARAHSEAGWMEQLAVPQYGGGNVHPGNAENLVLVGELARVLFPLPYSLPAGASGIAFPALQNGWAPFAGLPAYLPRAVLENGLVTMNGLIRPGTRSSLTTLTTLPVGYRPPSNKFFSASTCSDGISCQIQVIASGVVRLAAPFTGRGFKGQYISLDGISFRTD